jgi:16S rRNA pseudouridine516 synthase
LRLDRYVSHATGLTRRETHIVIRRGEVTVNNVVVKNAAFHVESDAVVGFRDEMLSAPGKRYLMLYKPEDYVCATTDETNPTVLSLLDLPHADRLLIAGRLDIDTTGLVLITDDGEWAHRVTSPRHDFVKTYRVTLAEPLSASAKKQLERGVQLKNEAQPCKPAQVELLPDSSVRISIAEGKYHQVKRMFAAVGNHVTFLHREKVGAVTLDPSLEKGESRWLTQEEIASFS